MLVRLESLDERVRAVLSHGIWQGQDENKPFKVTTAVLDAAASQDIPDPMEQQQRLILYLGSLQTSTGLYVKLSCGHLRAKIGSADPSSEYFTVTSAVDAGLVDNGTGTGQDYGMRLTMAGWKQYHELKRGSVVSRTAFMAMPFKNPELTRVVNEVFRPAVQETGFTLRRVDDEPQAGLIDNKIRVDIRLSRFLIADLTGGNSGAYWEAGYAEGLGKPVLYTCSKAHFEEHRTHFDTNHCTTVLWDPDNLAKTAEDLKVTIRATLPFEARMPQE
jgi:hypothetical protein